MCNNYQKIFTAAALFILIQGNATAMVNKRSADDAGLACREKKEKKSKVSKKVSFKDYNEAVIFDKDKEGPLNTSKKEQLPMAIHDKADKLFKSLNKEELKYCFYNIEVSLLEKSSLMIEYDRAKANLINKSSAYKDQKERLKLLEKIKIHDGLTNHEKETIKFYIKRALKDSIKEKSSLKINITMPETTTTQTTTTQTTTTQRMTTEASKENKALQDLIDCDQKYNELSSQMNLIRKISKLKDSEIQYLLYNILVVLLERKGLSEEYNKAKNNLLTKHPEYQDQQKRIALLENQGITTYLTKKEAQIKVNEFLYYLAVTS